MEYWKDFQMKFSKYMVIDGDFLVTSSISAYFTLIKPCCSWSTAWGTVGRERDWKLYEMKENDRLKPHMFAAALQHCTAGAQLEWNESVDDWGEEVRGLVLTLYIYIYVHIYIYQAKEFADDSAQGPVVVWEDSGSQCPACQQYQLKCLWQRDKSCWIKQLASLHLKKSHLGPLSRLVFYCIAAQTFLKDFVVLLIQFWRSVCVLVGLGVALPNKSFPGFSQPLHRETSLM